MKTIEQIFQEDAQKLVARVNEIEPALNATIEDGFIIGTYRAKKGMSFRYAIPSKTFLVNGSGDYAFNAINKAVQEIEVIGVSNTPLTNN